MNKIRIAIDLDDTVFEFAKEYFLLVEEKYGIKKNFEDISSYNFWEVLDISKDEAISIAHKLYNSDRFSELNLVEMVKEILDKILDSMEVYFITSRHKSSEEKTKKNLKLYFPNKNYKLIFSGDFFGGNKTKVEICKELGISVIIEDNLIYAKECAEKGIKSILLKKPWNDIEYENKNMIRVSDWNEILGVLKDEN